MSGPASTAAAVLDDALDRLVVPGYGRPGLALRRRLPGWPAGPARMDGAAVLVTGAAGGIGLAAAEGFARLGARVHALARSGERAAAAAEAILRAVPGAEVVPEVLDASSVAAASAFAAGFAARPGARLDVLVHNAGVMPARRTTTGEGHELMFATHVLVPFALTAGLADLLAASAPAAVVHVASGGMYTQPLDAGDPESEQQEYRPAAIYARTKRAEVVLSGLWAERLGRRGVAVTVMHPGWVDTPGVADALPGFRRVTGPILRTSAEGADTIVWLGAERNGAAGPPPPGSPPRVWTDRRPRPTRHPLGPADPARADAERLWAWCERAVARHPAAA